MECVGTSPLILKFSRSQNSQSYISNGTDFLFPGVIPVPEIPILGDIGTRFTVFHSFSTSRKRHLEFQNDVEYWFSVSMHHFSSVNINIRSYCKFSSISPLPKKSSCHLGFQNGVEHRFSVLCTILVPKILLVKGTTTWISKWHWTRHRKYPPIPVKKFS